MNANVIRTGGVHVFISQEFRKNLHSLSRLFAARTDRQFQFDKRRQLFIRPHNEPFSVSAMRVNNPDYLPLEFIVETQPQLQPALLRLSAMISQYFTRDFQTCACEPAHLLSASRRFMTPSRSVVAMRVRDKDRSPRTIHSCNARGLPKARQEKGSSPGHGGVYSAKTNTAQNQVSVNRTASKAKEGISCQYQYPSCPRQEATCRFQ